MTGLEEGLFNTPAGKRLAPWRRKLGAFCESKPWEMFTLTVLLIDVMIFFMRLLILEDAFGQGETVQDMDHALEVMSIVVLSLFCVDIALLLVASGLLYFRHIGYIVDFIIVPTALILEIFVGSLGGVLVIFRLWRVLRVLGKTSGLRVNSASKKIKRVERGLVVSSQGFTRVVDANSFKDKRVDAYSDIIKQADKRGSDPEFVGNIDRLTQNAASLKGSDLVVYDFDTPDEQTAMDGAWSWWDLDNNGRLTTNELRSMLNRTRCVYDEANLNAILRLMDLDNSGAVEREDFMLFRRMLNGRFQVGCSCVGVGCEMSSWWGTRNFVTVLLECDVCSDLTLCLFFL